MNGALPHQSTPIPDHRSDFDASIAAIRRKHPGISVDQAEKILESAVGERRQRTSKGGELVMKIITLATGAASAGLLTAAVVPTSAFLSIIGAVAGLAVTAKATDLAHRPSNKK